jgi:hypothetical protein
MRPHLARLVSLGAALCLLGGCATTPKPATAAAGEYEYVTPLGSNIPVRVPKGQNTAPNTTSPTGTMSADQLGTMINSAGGKVPVDKGGGR